MSTKLRPYRIPPELLPYFQTSIRLGTKFRGITWMSKKVTRNSAKFERTEETEDLRRTLETAMWQDGHDRRRRDGQNLTGRTAGTGK
jgi:hypothetical protein